MYSADKVCLTKFSSVVLNVSKSPTRRAVYCESLSIIGQYTLHWMIAP